MTKEILSRKIEKNLKAGVQDQATAEGSALAGIPIWTRFEQGEATSRRIVIMVRSISLESDMLLSPTPKFSGDCIILVEIPALDLDELVNEQGQMDAICWELFSCMHDQSWILSFFNKPTSGEDKRAATGMHLEWFKLMEEATDENTEFGLTFTTGLRFSLKGQMGDSH